MAKLLYLIYKITTFALMKFFIKIFTIYIFALSFAPCGDGGGGILIIADHLIGIRIAIQDTSEIEQNSDPCEESPCSPFCICSSCYTAFDTVKEIPLPQRILITPPKTTPSFIPHFNSITFNHSIWQPPQLG